MVTVIGSISFLILINSFDKQDMTIIDPIILKFTDDFAVSSNFHITEIFTDKKIQGISLIVSPKGDVSHLALKDPLKLLQKLYPDNNIIDYTVLVNEIEIPIEKNNNKLSLHVNNTDEIIQIIGINKKN